MDIKTKIKVLLGKALTDEQLKELKSDIVKMEAEIAAGQVSLMEVKTKEGLVFSHEGEFKEGTILSIIDPETKTQSVVPDGAYTLEDGTMIEIVESAVKTIKTPGTEDTPPGTEQMEAKFAAYKKEVETKQESLNTELSNRIADLKKVVLSQSKMIEQILSAPLDTIEVKDTKEFKILSEEEYNNLPNFEKVQYKRQLKNG